jgi:hypothetical protein
MMLVTGRTKDVGLWRMAGGGPGHILHAPVSHADGLESQAESDWTWL